MKRLLGVITLGLCVAGCGAGGAERWLSATRENVQVEGIPYHVAWLRSEPRAIDFRVHRDQALVIMPDAVVEKDRGSRAASIVAQRECQTQNVQVEQIDRYDQMFTGRIRCG